MSEELARIERKIEGLADAEIASGQPYLLSKLGMDLGPDLKLVKQEGMTLAEFVKSRFGDKYDIIFTGEYKNIQSLIGKSSEMPDVSGKADDVEEEKRPERFNYRFWAAFSVPLEGKSRFLNMDNFSFEDVDAAPSGRHERIDAEFIAPEDAQDRDKLVLQNIRRWIDAKGFKSEQFLAKRRVGRTASDATPSRTLLHAFVDALDKKQLSSVSLPLDVVAALLNRSA
ncbi:MAG: hypothetical protein KJ670_19555 [Alphaproteobacteria bacterium]|nr:hypothetical protein [Rhizobiaceae bacterium]MBU3959583.1 hypothetical protein [Alphaproteobacteria bacterium]MBU4050588.1 hypothetical protein [Alphaproteobacteria bacterium]MBU4090913.1 hypothetical protein [Alphaproteobacteria bacterium]MBU4157119.1 hypothetical protein [Alphaproteobacteria bacterium]